MSTETRLDGADLIALERERQITDEGWVLDHDDQHSMGELIMAARAYLGAGTPESTMPEAWPWETEAWKPRDRVRNLVKAAALVAAEIDRLTRRETR